MQHYNYDFSTILEKIVLEIYYYYYLDQNCQLDH